MDEVEKALHTFERKTTEITLSFNVEYVRLNEHLTHDLDDAELARQIANKLAGGAWTVQGAHLYERILERDGSKPITESPAYVSNYQILRIVHLKQSEEA